MFSVCLLVYFSFDLFTLIHVIRDNGGGMRYVKYFIIIHVPPFCVFTRFRGLNESFDIVDCAAPSHLVHTKLKLLDGPAYL